MDGFVCITLTRHVQLTPEQGCKQQTRLPSAYGLPGLVVQIWGVQGSTTVTVPDRRRAGGSLCQHSVQGSHLLMVFLAEFHDMEYSGGYDGFQFPCWSGAVQDCFKRFDIDAARAEDMGTVSEQTTDWWLSILTQFARLPSAYGLSGRVARYETIRSRRLHPIPS